MNENQNLILAVVLCLGVFLVWQHFIGRPQMEQQQRLAEQQAQARSAETPGQTGTLPGSASVSALLSRSDALAKSQRITIDSPRVDGSIALTGASFDDLSLKDYRETPDKKSPEIVLLSPRDTAGAYYASFGWSSPSGGSVDLPGPDTPWQLTDGSTLTPNHSVTLRWSNDRGVTFTRVIALDSNYMFTITDQVENGSAAAVALAPYAYVARQRSLPKQSTYILHEGLLGAFDGTIEQNSYKDMMEKREKRFTPEKAGGWVGMTDKYWMAALIPDQNERIAARFMEQPVTSVAAERTGLFQSDFVGGVRTVQPGATIEVTNRFFAGAKEVDVINGYNDSLKITKFSYAIDWGWFHFITRPMFFLLDKLFALAGNFGIAILLLTVVVKLLFFPLANKSYEAMSKMKNLQPEMVRLREVYKDDKAKQQQELMALYAKEKVNPFAGCLPILVQIPVFFSLYKVLFITIEMRHAPFYGWIKDLSAPDPTNLFNLFGLLPFDPTQLPVLGSFLHIGIWPLIMGATMVLQMKMNPAPPDPVQQKVFALMPYIFTFMLASFPAGLVIYWSWNNLLSIVQQYVIMRRMKVDMEWDKKFGGLLRLYRMLKGRTSKGSDGSSPGQQPGE